MKNIIAKLVVGNVLLFACLAPNASFAGDKVKHEPRKSGIIGQVVQLPGPWDIRIVTEDDTLVTDIQADDDGAFEVDLKPGTYILTPFFPSIDGTAELVGVAATVTVEKKEFTTVELDIVHGPE